MVAPPIFPTGYNIGDVNSAFDEDPELSSIVRPSDATGIPKGYNNQALLLSEQEAKAEDDAMSYLRMAMRKSAEVTPTQGAAAALLAAIPTLGGYLIGKSVGPADIPEGFYGADLSKYATGGAYGGMQGAQVGASAASQYLGGLEADQAQANEAYQKMAAIEARKSERIGNRLEAQQAEADMLPLREASQMRLQNNAAQNTMDRQLEMDNIRAQREELAPEVIAKIQTELGIPLDPTMNTTKLKVVVAALEAKRRQEGQNFRQTEAKGAEYIPGAEILPGANPDITAIKPAREAVTNYKQLNDIYIPELKRVFSDPNVTVDEQQAALAAAVVAIKTQQKMGANFTALEESLVKAGLPRIATLSVSDSINAMKASVQGQDALAKIQRLQDITNMAVEAQLNPLGYTIAKGGSSGGIPSVGSSYNGSKVLKVTKIR